MAGPDELAQLEAERDRLLSMIDYHNGPFYHRIQPRSRGTTLGEILALFLGVVTTVGGRPVGETEAHQRLADCEAQIMKLKEGRP
jgi:hypothetical protein